MKYSGGKKKINKCSKLYFKSSTRLLRTFGSDNGQIFVMLKNSDYGKKKKRDAGTGCFRIFCKLNNFLGLFQQGDKKPGGKLVLLCALDFG